MRGNKVHNSVLLAVTVQLVNCGIRNYFRYSRFHSDRSEWTHRLVELILLGDWIFFSVSTGTIIRALSALNQSLSNNAESLMDRCVDIQ